MSNFHDLLEYVEDAKAEYSEFKQLQQNNLRRKQKGVASWVMMLADAACDIGQAEQAFKLAPRHTTAKWVTYQKWVSFCSTLEELRNAARFWANSRRYFHFAPAVTMDGDLVPPFLEKWVALSLAELKAATTMDELRRAYSRSPDEYDYPMNYSGKSPCRSNTGSSNRQILYQFFSECGTFEELEEFRQKLANNPDHWPTHNCWEPMYDFASKRLTETAAARALSAH